MKAESLELDFNPEDHDKMMDTMFDDDYYDEEVINPEVEDIEKIQENDIDILRIEKTEELPISLKQGTNGTW